MKQSLDEWKLLNKLRIACLKHRCDVVLVCKEMGFSEDDQHISYVKKFIDKFRKQEDRNISVLIANNLLSIILEGSQSRITHLTEMLNFLAGKESAVVSSCCEAPVTTRTSGDQTVHTCIKCNFPCRVIQLDRLAIYSKKQEILRDLRAEDQSLVEMAEKLGFTNSKTEPTTVVNTRQNILVIGDKDKQRVEEIEKLPLMAQHQLLEKLHKEITQINAAAEEPKEEGS